MSIKYEVNQWGQPEITPVKCIKETPKQVWIERTYYLGHKDVSRKSKEGVFFDTWKEAHSFILDRAKAGVKTAKIRLEREENELALINSMTEPTTTENQP